MSNTRTVLAFGKCLQELLKSQEQMELSYTFLSFQKEQFFYMCLVIAFILSVLFLFVWVETSNEYNGFDW